MSFFARQCRSKFWTMDKIKRKLCWLQLQKDHYSNTFWTKSDVKKISLWADECLNPSQWGGGSPPAPPSTYWSTISTQFEIRSSPLVTFNFKTLPKHRLTQFWNFLAQIWEKCDRRQVVRIGFDKKIGKIWFFSIFFQINHTFSVWNWILWEKCFLLRYCMLK